MASRTTPHFSRTRRISSLAVIFVVLSCGVALAWTSQTMNPGNAVTADTLAAPTNPNGANAGGTTTACGTITVSWAASAAPVNTYIVQARTANGSFATINGDTGNVTSITDPTVYTLRDVTYRVAGEYKNGTLTNWSSAYATDASPLTCGTFGEVSSLTATMGCMSATATWPAVPGATQYDRQYSLNGGTTWTQSLNVTGTSYTVNFASANAGQPVIFQVRPRTATITGVNWSNTTPALTVDCPITATPTATPNTCFTNAVVTWPAASGAVDYDVRASIDNGSTWAYSPGTNLTVATLTDSTAYPVASNVIWQVRAGPSTTIKGQWSASSAPANNWSFGITSIAFGNTNGTLASGDTIVVTFNRATDGANPTGTNSQNVYIQVSAGTRGIYLGAGTNAAASTAIAYVPFNGNLATGTSGIQAGAGVWSAGNTVWTWNRGAAAGAAFSTPVWLAGNLTVGSSAANPSRVKCSDGTTTLVATTPTKTGWF